MGIGLFGGIDKRFIEGQNLYVYLQSANFISFWPTLLHTVGFGLARAGGPIASLCAEWLKASLW